MSKSSRLLASFVVASSLSLAACSGSDDSGNGANGGSGGGGSGGTGNTSSLPNPCTMLSHAELNAIFAVDVVTTQLITGLSGDPSCTWFDADSYGVFQLALWNDLLQHEFWRDDPDSLPLSGIGDDAYLGSSHTVNVAVSGKAFFTQALQPVEDGVIGPEVQAAATGATADDIAKWEAAFRGAELVVNDF